MTLNALLLVFFIWYIIHSCIKAIVKKVAENYGDNYFIR